MADIEVSEAEWRNAGFERMGKGKNYVFFYDKQIEHKAKSKEAGRPIFITRTMIKKIVPGDHRLVVDTYAREDDYENFPVEYARYQQKHAAKPEGTPIDAWPVLSDTQKAEFRALNIFTVEQFAALPDAANEKIMGLHELRKKARAFVLAQEAGEKLVKLEEEKKADEAEKAEMRKVIAEMTARLAALEINTKA
ncbi:MAG TPA: hypothetical protein VFR10_13340, partial [bacterium]|nr:hypothetical protein [bacterium]